MSRTLLMSLLILCLLEWSPHPARAASPKGAKITGTKNAELIRKVIENYDWELEKAVPVGQVPFVIPIGDHEFAFFTVIATRKGPFARMEDDKIRGSVCISNRGNEQTKGLRILDRLEVFQNGQWLGLTPWTPIPGVTDVRAGQRICFPYDIDMTLDLSGKYRNHAMASIQNSAGVRPAPGSISIYSDVKVKVVENIRGAYATVTDTFSCPEGFVCSPEKQTWIIHESTAIPFEVKIANVSSPCGSTSTVINHAKLKPSDTKDSESDRTATATITIFTGSCEGTIFP
jgi:hypothetical protein